MTPSKRDIDRIIGGLEDQTLRLCPRCKQVLAIDEGRQWSFCDHCAAFFPSRPPSVPPPIASRDHHDAKLAREDANLWRRRFFRMGWFAIAGWMMVVFLVTRWLGL